MSWLVECCPEPRAVPGVLMPDESLDDSDGLLMSLLYSHVAWNRGWFLAYYQGQVNRSMNCDGHFMSL